MSGFDALLWQALHRASLVLVIGALGLLLGLGSRPDRADSLYGVLVVLIVTVLIGVTVARMPASARGKLPELPRNRPMLALTAGLTGCATLLVLWWTVANAVSPGTFAPLSLALLAGIAAEATALLRRVRRRA